MKRLSNPAPDMPFAVAICCSFVISMAVDFFSSPSFSGTTGLRHIIPMSFADCAFMAVGLPHSNTAKASDKNIVFILYAFCFLFAAQNNVCLADTYRHCGY